jgi:ketosteroid isomerase-like protein
MEMVRTSLRRRNFFLLGASATVTSVLFDRVATAQPQLRQGGFKLDLVRRLFAALDEMEVDKAITFFTENARYQFGNAEPVVGRTAIREAVVSSFPLFKTVHHSIQTAWEQGNELIVQLQITHTLQNGKVVKLPAADVFQFEGNLIRNVQVYIDPSPLKAT